MFGRSLGKIGGAVAAVGVLYTGFGGIAIQADDTEIYQSTYEAGADGRPKVVIIVDDSGSMDSIVQEGGEKPVYDPNATYVSAFDSTRVYWSSNSEPPPANTRQWFPVSKNRCGESYTPLATVGKFTTKARRWRSADGEWVTTERVCLNRNPNTGVCRRWREAQTNWIGEEAGWAELTQTVRNPVHVDCQADRFSPGNPSNGSGQGDGYPVRASGPDASDAEAYTANRLDSNVRWGRDGYTFYSAHYMDWVYDDTLPIAVEKDRLQVAQEVVSELINTNTAIDFGLAVFNDNGEGATNWYQEDGRWYTTPNIEDDNGGRIVSRIIEGMTTAQREALAGPNGVINSIEHNGWTPLCESAYEVYRYLAGATPQYGKDADSIDGAASAGLDGNTDSPARDTLAEEGGKYKSPNTDCAYTYVILMTDGFPTFDEDANTAIETLTGKTCANYLSDHYDFTGSREMRKNCLPTLTEYMANQDLDNDASNGNQFGLTYTIGFATNQKLLEDAALKAKGKYYTADNAEELTEAFQGAILSILSTDSTFTSPAVAVDTFTRTQSRNEVFFAMFKPTDTLDWPGNIKRLNIALNNGTATLVDKGNQPAMDSSTGLIAEAATTVWTRTADAPDGPTVEKGGVGALLARANLTTRANRMWTNTGANGALEKFTQANIDEAAYSIDPNDPAGAEAVLLAKWNVSSRAHLDEVIDWAIGYDVDDANENNRTNDNRDWLLGDILHSKPLVVNYGALGSFTTTNPDMRIVTGTNAGFVHMFGNSDGEEDWAFFGKELGSVLSARKENYTSATHIYGIDSPPVVYTLDKNLDGTLDRSVGDKAWLYSGLRRGGRIVYALDISNPDVPSFLWQIDEDTAGFEEIGLTFSVPVLSKIPGYADANGIPKPVLIFGGGYDVRKDDHNTLANSADTMGRGVFIVDAETGALVWSVTPAANSSTNLRETGMLHSVPGSVTPLDSNGDELTDRIYFADTGGNVWRIDMPLNALPTASQNSWRIHKLFAANGGTKRTDRRFFSAPDVVRTNVDGEAMDAILIGSGDRTNPAELDDPVDANDPSVDNQFYMIRDMQVSPYFTAYNASACDPNDPAQDFRCNLPLSPAALYDVTPNLIQDGTTAEQAQARLDLLNAFGWRLDLGANGEKSLARSLTIAGQLYFTTFSPDTLGGNICEPLPGTGRLYNVSLFDASAVRDFDLDSTYERAWVVGGLIPDTPSPHFGSDGEIRLLLPPGGGSAGPAGNPFETGAELPGPYGSFWYREEY